MDDLKLEKLISYWTEHAEYDIETAQAMFDSKRYPYALFMCHLAVEKILKGRVVFCTKEHAEYTHNLVRLAQQAHLQFSKEQLSLLEALQDFNMEARYPEEEKEFYKRATMDFSENYLTAAKLLFVWIKTSLKK